MLPLLLWGGGPTLSGLAANNLLSSTALHFRLYFRFLSKGVLTASFTASMINQCSLLDFPRLLQYSESIFPKMRVSVYKALPPGK